MFVRTVVRRVRTLPAFGVFLKQTKGQFTGIPATQRAKKLGSLYRNLSAADKAKLKAAGAKIKVVPRVKAPKAPRKLTAYNRFVKANYGKVKNLPFSKRLGAIAKLWKASA